MSWLGHARKTLPHRNPPAFPSGIGTIWDGFYGPKPLWAGSPGRNELEAKYAKMEHMLPGELRSRWQLDVWAMSLCMFDRIQVNRHLAALEYVDVIRFDYRHFSKRGVEFIVYEVRTRKGLCVVKHLDLVEISHGVTGHLLIGKPGAKEWIELGYPAFAELEADSMQWPRTDNNGYPYIGACPSFVTKAHISSGESK